MDTARGYLYIEAPAISRDKTKGAYTQQAPKSSILHLTQTDINQSWFMKIPFTTLYKDAGLSCLSCMTLTDATVM